MNSRKLYIFIATTLVLLSTSYIKDDPVVPEEEPDICIQIQLLENEEEFVAKLINLLDDTRKKIMRPAILFILQAHLPSAMSPYSESLINRPLFLIRAVR